MATPLLLPTTTAGVATSSVVQSLATKISRGSSSGDDDTSFDGGMNGLVVGNNNAADMHVVPRRPAAKFWNVFIIVISIACMGVAVTAMVVVNTTLVYVTFAVPLLFTAPLVLVQRCRLRGQSPIALLRQSIRHIRGTGTRLHHLNHLFRTEIARLAQQQRELRHVERQLQTTVHAQGHDLQQLQRLLHEYGRIRRQMQRLQGAQELQQLLTILLNSDRNRDHVYSEQEIDQLMIRLKASFSLVDASRLRSVFDRASLKSLGRLYHEAVTEDEYFATFHQALVLDAAACFDYSQLE